MQYSFKEYTILEATNTDQKAVQDIIFSTLEEYGLKPEEDGIDSDLKDLEGNYTQKNGFFGIIKDKNQKTVGTLALYDCGEGIAEIRKMYFLPETRGQGLGKFVLQFLIDLAKEKGFSTIQLETANALKTAIALYQKFGFSEIKPVHLADRCDRAFELNIEI